MHRLQRAQVDSFSVVNVVEPLQYDEIEVGANGLNAAVAKNELTYAGVPAAKL
jgi:hypothetical protein